GNGHDRSVTSDTLREIVNSVFEQLGLHAEQQPVGWQSIVLHASELADMVLKGDAPQTAQRTARALLSMLAAPQPEQSGLVDWAVDRWHAEVANRPLINVHRRTLDSTWRQVIRRLGEDDVV